MLHHPCATRVICWIILTYYSGGRGVRTWFNSKKWYFWYLNQTQPMNDIYKNKTHKLLQKVKSELNIKSNSQLWVLLWYKGCWVIEYWVRIDSIPLRWVRVISDLPWLSARTRFQLIEVWYSRVVNKKVFTM